MVIEYEGIEKIFYYSLIPFIIGFTLFIIGLIPSISCTKCIMSFTAQQTNIRPILDVLVVIGASSLLKMTCMFMRKEYRYYFAKGSFILATEVGEDKKMKYLDLMLDSYNKP